MGFEFVAGDTASKLRVFCKDSDASVALDLSGSTVLLRWNKNSDGSLVEKQMTITDAALGIAEYQFLAGELEAPVMTFAVKVTFADSTFVSSDGEFYYTVRQPLS